MHALCRSLYAVALHPEEDRERGDVQPLRGTGRSKEPIREEKDAQRAGAQSARVRSRAASDAPLHAQHGRCAALAGACVVAPRRSSIQRERHRAQEAGGGLGLRGQHARPQPRVHAQLQARQRPASVILLVNLTYCAARRAHPQPRIPASDWPGSGLRGCREGNISTFILSPALLASEHRPDQTGARACDDSRIPLTIWLVTLLQSARHRMMRMSTLTGPDPAEYSKCAKHQTNRSFSQSWVEVRARNPAPALRAKHGP